MEMDKIEYGHAELQEKSIEERCAYYQRILQPFLESDGSFAGPFAPKEYGFLRSDNEAGLAENAYLALSVREAKGGFKLLSLGAAPGEWAIRAERLYRKLHDTGDYMSVCVEADLGHVRIMEDFFRNNQVDRRKTIILYAAVADMNGWAYMPVIDSPNSWGCGTVAVAAAADANLLDANVKMSSSALASATAGVPDKEVEFFAVMALSLEWLLNFVGVVDLIHCDIQGAEGKIFSNNMGVLGSKVHRCCISIHGQRIEDNLIKLFETSGWILEVKITGIYTREGEFEDSQKDGVQIWRNPMLS